MSSGSDLLAAAREGDFKAFETILSQNKGLINTKDNLSESTAAHLAAANGHADILKLILSENSDLASLPNSSGDTPLHWAALTGSLDCVKLLVEAGADPHQVNKAGIDSIYQAHAASQEGIIEYILSKEVEAEN